MEEIKYYSKNGKVYNYREGEVSRNDHVLHDLSSVSDVTIFRYHYIKCVTILRLRKPAGRPTCLELAACYSNAFKVMVTKYSNVGYWATV